MLCVGGADNLLSLDYPTIIHMQRMRVKTFGEKIMKKEHYPHCDSDRIRITAAFL